MVLTLSRAIVAAIAAAMLSAAVAAAAEDPLPSWRSTDRKAAILAFVEAVTTPSSDLFVPVSERIAVFDNDGTLWTEQPMYTQLAFVFDRIEHLAPEHPEWKTTQPFQAVLEGDMKALAATGKKGLLEIVAATHAGMSTGEFEEIVSDWIAKAKHPRFDRLYTDLAFQPMLELLAYLSANDFKIFIVSGGGIEFMRPWSERVYGIPPERVVGSSITTEYKLVDGKPTLMRTSDIDFVDDKEGKPVGINAHIGRHPIIAVGNSDGDRQMLDWVQSGDGPRLLMLVLHDDAEREYAYGPATGLPDTHFGAFPQALFDHATASGWHVIGMKDDWAEIFPSAE